jgi:hypothetical protein
VTIPQARPSTGWTQIDWAPHLSIARLTSQQPDITDELFSLLRFISEIPDEGKRLIQFHSNTTNPVALDALYRLTRAFIRQAENYYRAARGLHYRSSALLYYYCFLNLAKAVLSVHGIPYKPTHGLSARTDTTSIDLGKQTVEVHRKGVFLAFYRQQLKTVLPNDVRLDVKSLLGYIPQITHEYETAGLGHTAALVMCKARLLADLPHDKAWWTIAIPGWYDPSALPEPNRSGFASEFEQVEMPPNKAREQFSIDGRAHHLYRFFQSRATTSWASGVPTQLPIVSLFGSLEGHIEPKLIDDGFDFTVFQPFAHALGPFRMTELPALYLVMFYLASLVRYRPDYLDSLLETRAAWMIESFVASAPLMALRSFVSKITDRLYIYNK